jgi:hypothetical protein
LSLKKVFFSLKAKDSTYSEHERVAGDKIKDSKMATSGRLNILRLCN